MNMFSSAATDSYIETISNSNLDTSVSIAQNYPVGISMKLHTQSSANNTVDPLEAGAGLRQYPSSPGGSYRVDLSRDSGSSNKLSSRSKFHSPSPLSGHSTIAGKGIGAKKINRFPSAQVSLEPHDDVLDFTVQDLNAISSNTGAYKTDLKTKY